jgi:hypothetical protein
MKNYLKIFKFKYIKFGVLKEENLLSKVIFEILLNYAKIIYFNILEEKI